MFLVLHLSIHVLGCFWKTMYYQPLGFVVVVFVAVVLRQGHPVAAAGLELTKICLPLPPEFWN